MLAVEKSSEIITIMIAWDAAWGRMVPRRPETDPMFGAITLF